MIGRFLAVSVAAHLAVLTAVGWPTANLPAHLTPPLRATLLDSAAPGATHQAGSEKRSRVTGAPPAHPSRQFSGRSLPADPPTPSAATADDGERSNHLQTLMRGALDQYFVYPPLARRYGWQGQVDLAVALDPQGEIQTLRIVRSSGYAILDQEALASVRRIGALPAARAWLAGRGYDIELPVIYRLVEG